MATLIFYKTQVTKKILLIMKKNIMLKPAFLFLASLMLLVGCIKNDPVIFTAPLAEFDAASWNANAAGQTYPIITRLAGFNRVANTTDSSLRRLSGTFRIRVNLVGAPSKKEETIGYKIFTTSPLPTVSFPATIAGQTPAAAAATLTYADGIQGTHFATLSGKVTIPADSAFGYLSLSVLNAGSMPGQARFLGIRLDSTGSLRPSVNYGTLGLAIDQR